jgi:hypothetical protein
MRAYRSAHEPARERCTLLCTSCGAPVGFGAREPECPCPRCGLHQPTARPVSELVAGTLEYVADDGRPYDELAEFCRSIGASGRALSVTVRVDGVVHVVSLSLNSGTVDGLDLTARTEGFPPMRLSREGELERQAKAAGVSREVQVGDAEFDAAVYVDSDASDRDVLLVLSSPAVRVAVQELLRSFKTIKLGAESVEVTGNRDTPSCFRAENVRRWLGALRVLAGAPRRRQVELTEPTSAATTIQAATWALSPLALGALFVAGSRVAPFHPAKLVLLGGGAGLVGWWLARGLFRRALSGRSNSHVRLLAVTVTTFFSVPMAVIAALLFANAALDVSTERVQSGRVTSSSWNDENGETTVEVRGDDLDVSFSVHDPSREVSVGAAATVWSKAGALGAPWPTRPGVVLVGARRLTAP